MPLVRRPRLRMKGAAFVPPLQEPRAKSRCFQQRDERLMRVQNLMIVRAWSGTTGPHVLAVFGTRMKTIRHGDPQRPAPAQKFEAIGDRRPRCLVIQMLPHVLGAESKARPGFPIAPKL